MTRFSTLARSLALAATMLPSTLLGSELPGDAESRLRERFREVSARHGSLFDQVDANDFRHPLERSIRDKLLADEKVKALLPDARREAEKFNRDYHRVHQLQGVVVSETQFPDIHQLGVEVSQALGMSSNFTIYVMNSAQMNAYTWSWDDSRYGVALFSGLIRGLTRQELKYVLAHEMGHVKSGHILTSILIELYHQKYDKLPAPLDVADPDSPKTAGETAARTVHSVIEQTLGDLPSDMALSITRRIRGAAVAPMRITEEQYLKLQSMQQAFEYSSDRAGLVASGDRDNSLKGLVKLASGDVGDLGGFELETYLAQIESVLEDMTRNQIQDLRTMEGSHAFTLMRVGELDEFHDSDEYAVARESLGTSVYRTVVSATFQVASKLEEATKVFDKLKKSKEFREMNALERRFKVRELRETIQPREEARSALVPLVLETMEGLGFAAPNAAFDIYVAFVKARRNGVALKPVSTQIVEKIQFELNRPDLDPTVREELERKLALAIEVRDLKPTTDDDDDDEEDEDDEDKDKAAPKATVPTPPDQPATPALAATR